MPASMSAEQILEQIFESDDELPEKLDGEVDKNVFSLQLWRHFRTSVVCIASEGTDGHGKAARVLATHL